MRSSAIPFLVIVAVSLFGCKTPEILLHGDIRGIITDAETNQPVQGASAKLISTNDSTGTGSDGSFLFKNLTPGQYEIRASKLGYDSIKQNIEVVSAQTKEIAFPLNGIPVPHSSVTFLDFSIDSTSLHFSVLNLGKVKFAYSITASQDWIKLSPSDGNITDSINIKVTINKTGLSQNIYNETITIISFNNLEPLPKIIIPVSLNGVRDHDGNYYKVVRIGSQIWMAENLNVGTSIPVDKSPGDNGIIEKYCYLDSKGNCDIYGGLYRWDEMMQYSSADTGLIGTKQGICPVGWHIPTLKEWATLAENVGGADFAGASLKEAGLSHWSAPNLGGNNESNFTALPGGGYTPPQNFAGYGGLGNSAHWWTSNEYYVKTLAYFLEVDFDTEWLIYDIAPTIWGGSVRCLKNTSK